VEVDGEWEWKDNVDLEVNGEVSDNDNVVTSTIVPPKLPSGSFKPKQSLGQNFLTDANTINRIISSFHLDATRYGDSVSSLVELGPGPGALTQVLIDKYGTDEFRCIGKAGAKRQHIARRNPLSLLLCSSPLFTAPHLTLPLISEIDDRAVEALKTRHPTLDVVHADVLQVDYPAMSLSLSSTPSTPSPLAVIGNLPYYITSQILFALADASHSDAVRSATVTMQLEVGQRLVAETSTKGEFIMREERRVKGKASDRPTDQRRVTNKHQPHQPFALPLPISAYGILSVVFQIYALTRLHFKIPPTVFYPKPKVDSCLIGLNFVGSSVLRSRFAGVRPSDLRRVLTSSFQQRRKTVRSSLKKLMLEVNGGDKDKVAEMVNGVPPEPPEGVRKLAKEGDEFAILQFLPDNWGSMRPEEFKPQQFIELTRLIFGDVQGEYDMGVKVWRKVKHGKN